MRASSAAPAAFAAALLLLASVAQGGEVSVFAAASVREAVNAASDAYESRHPGVRIVRIFGGSGALARQVEAGAPCDLFVPAGDEWEKYLSARGRIAVEKAPPLAYNTLVFVGRAGVRAAAMKDLPALGRVAVGNPRSVPAGAYAMQALERSGLAKSMEGKLVRARDVREALLYAERGEADGAFVYRTDALRSSKVKILFVVPEELHDRVAYPAGLTVTGARNGEARSFLAFLRSPEARALFDGAGFRTR